MKIASGRLALVTHFDGSLLSAGRYKGEVREVHTTFLLNAARYATKVASGY